MLTQGQLEVKTRGRGCVDLTSQVNAIVAESGVATGVCQVFLHHTSASLMFCENADPVVLRDMEAFMSRLVPDGDPVFAHTEEGPDDMPAHVRSVLAGASLSLPVTAGHCGLGIWQGIFLWEHRTVSHRRRVTVTVQGE